MSEQQESSQNQGSTFFMIVIIMAVVIFGAQYFRNDAVEIWRQMRIGELWLLRYVDFLPYLNTLGIENAYWWLINNTPETITNNDIAAFDNRFAILRYLYLPIPIYLGFKLYQSLMNRNRSYDMETLLGRVSQWPKMPFLKEFLKRSPEKDETIVIKKDKSNLQDAVSMTPTEFCTMVPAPGTNINRPIYEEPPEDADEGEVGFFDKELARKALDAQIGDMWTGNPNDLKDYEKKLFDTMFSQVIKSGYAADFNIKNEEDRVKKQKVQVMKELNRHAYVRTMFITLFDLTKGGGVQASLNHRWIKGVDRTLWYCLSSVGRKTPFVESAGVHAHWELEREVKMPIPFIETEMAVRGLEFTIFGPQEEEDDPIYN
jgi:hypothetical protein